MAGSAQEVPGQIAQEDAKVVGMCPKVQEHRTQHNVQLGGLFGEWCC